MLTSFFGFSKVTNYILLSIIIAISYVAQIFVVSDGVFSLVHIATHILWISLLIFSMLLLDFIVRKNALTKNTTYAIFIYTLCITMLPVIFKQTNIIVSNVLLLLALRRIVSLNSEKNSEKKILEAAFYIALSSIFYFWSIFYFLLLYVAISKKPEVQFRYFFIPFIGILTVLTLTTTYFLITTNSFYWIFDIRSNIGFDFSSYNDPKTLIPATLLLTFAIWMGGSRLTALHKLQRKEKANVYLLLLALCISFIITITVPQKTGAELLFIVAPISIISANYFENEEEKRRNPLEFWFKETLLWLFVLLPFIIWAIR